jgi:hypothetical protein
MELKRMTAGNGKNTLEGFQLNPEGVAVRVKRGFRRVIDRTKRQWEDSSDAPWVFESDARILRASNHTYVHDAAISTCD